VQWIAKDMAPIRALPIGSASVMQSLAGVLNQRDWGKDADADALALMLARRRSRCGASSPKLFLKPSVPKHDRFLARFGTKKGRHLRMGALLVFSG